MYVSMHACMHVCIYVCMCICMYVYIYISSINTYLYLLGIFHGTGTSSCMVWFYHPQISIYTYIHTYIHTYIYIYIHLHPSMDTWSKVMFGSSPRCHLPFVIIYLPKIQWFTNTKRGARITLAFTIDSNVTSWWRGCMICPDASTIISEFHLEFQ